MKVILLEEVEKLGKAGEVKVVSDGYARNFLIPRGFAEPATEKNLKMLGERLTTMQVREERERARYQALADKLQATPLRFTLRVGEQGQVFGSITANDITEEFAKNAITVEKNWIELVEPIKTAKEHTITVKLPHQITAEVKLFVEPSGA